MIDETHLLRQYAEDANEGAFAELVRRKVDFVYSAAMRQVNGDAQLADEVTQGVFLDLARKARSLTRHATLAGWLYTSTRFAAAKAVRTQRRWHQRNEEARSMHEIEQDSPGEPGWAQLRPVLDAALGELGDRDREALLLRFFEDRPLAEVGARIGLSENSARMRVDRALDKLRTALARRGVTSTTAALALTLTQEAVTAAPAGLAAAAAGSALAGAGMAGGVGAGAAKIISLMAISKIQAGAAGLLGLAVAAALFLQHRDNAQLVAENDSLHAQVAELSTLRRENQRLSAENTTAQRPGRMMAANPGGPGRRIGNLAGPDTTAKFTMAYSLDDPEMNRLMDIQQKGQLEVRYGALFKALDLSSSQREQLKKMLLDRQNIPRDVLTAGKAQGLGDADIQASLPAMIEKSRTDIEAGIRDLLGDNGYQKYQQYQGTLPQRALAEQLASRLNSTSSPLTGEQTEQLVQILAANSPPAPTGLPSAGGDQVMFHREVTSVVGEGVAASPVVAFANSGMVMNSSATVSDAAIAQAQTVLTPPQLEALQGIQAEQQAAQALGQHMMSNLPAQITTSGGN